MSIEIVIYPPTATKEQLVNLLLTLRFRKIKQNRMFPPGDFSHFHWFEAKDFQSTDGVEATIYLTNDKEKQEFSAGDWAVHTRTRIWASYFDLEKQNATIRAIRKHFKGNFLNDSAGINRYVKLTPETRSPLGRGIYTVYEHTYTNLDKIIYVINNQIEFNIPEPDNPFYEDMAKADPIRIVYNMIPVFSVAAIEFFLSEVFILLLKYDVVARNKLKDQSKKIDMSEVMEIASGEKEIERVIANWYSFQNLLSINKAYSEWFGIDILKLLQKKKKVGKKIRTLLEHISSLIESRHDFIHRFDFDTALTKDEVRSLVKLAQLFVDVIVEYLEDNRGIKIHDENYGWYVSVLKNKQVT